MKQHTRLVDWQHTQESILVNVTIPVFNEEARLQSSIPKLHGFLSRHWEDLRGLARVQRNLAKGKYNSAMSKGLLQAPG